MRRSGSQTYDRVVSEGSEGRELEASVLLKAARRLQACLDSVGAHDAARMPALDEALRYNQRLWTIFQVDLSGPDNPLPLELRRNLLRLSLYVDKCTFQLFGQPDRGKLESLVRINVNIAEGLLTAPPAREQAFVSQDAPHQETLDIAV